MKKGRLRTVQKEVAQWIEANGYMLPLGQNKYYDILSDEIFVHKPKADEWVKADMRRV